jgi:hypothetical protein
MPIHILSSGVLSRICDTAFSIFTPFNYHLVTFFNACVNMSY